MKREEICIPTPTTPEIAAVHDTSVSEFIIGEQWRGGYPILADTGLGTD